MSTENNKWGSLQEKVSKPKDEIIAIIDRSGSMAGIIDDAVGGFNAFLKENKEVEGEANITFVIFDNVVEARERQDLSTFKDITVKDVQPRGMTAMNDAIGMTLNGFEPEDDGAKVAVVIITDGGENASKEYTDRDTIKKMIERLKEDKGWQFTFLAANMDAFEEACSFGVGAGNTMNFAATGEGVRSAYLFASADTVSYRTSSPKNQSHQAVLDAIQLIADQNQGDSDKY